MAHRVPTRDDRPRRRRRGAAHRLGRERIVYETISNCTTTTFQGSFTIRFTTNNPTHNQAYLPFSSITSLTQTRTTAIILITVFLHAVAFFSGTSTYSTDAIHNILTTADSYTERRILPSPLLPSTRFQRNWRRYQVRQMDTSTSPARLLTWCTHHIRSHPLRRMLPYSLGSSILSAFGGMLVSRTHKYRPIMWASYFVMTIGYGLMIRLDDRSSMCVQVQNFSG